MYPPRRLQDYANMYFITRFDYNKLTLKEKQSKNYLVVAGKEVKCSFGNHKTAKHYGVKTFAVKGD